MAIETYFIEIIGIIGILAGFVAGYYLYQAKKLTKEMLSFALQLILTGVILISLSAAFCVFEVITNSEGKMITLIEDILKFLGLVIIGYGGFKLYHGFKEISSNKRGKK